MAIRLYTFAVTASSSKTDTKDNESMTSSLKDIRNTAVNLTLIISYDIRLTRPYFIEHVINERYQQIKKCDNYRFKISLRIKMSHFHQCNRKKNHGKDAERVSLKLSYNDMSPSCRNAFNVHQLFFLSR